MSGLSKRISAFLISAALALNFMGFAAFSETAADSYFVFENGTIAGYNGIGGDVIIPREIYGTSVTGIGDYAFSDSVSLTSITIPESVTVIGNDVFRNCSNLISVTFKSQAPPELKINAFLSCNNALTIYVPIGARAYKAMPQLSRYNIEESAPAHEYEYDDNECRKLAAFCKQDSNRYLLEWDLENPESWTGVTWTDDNPRRVRGISISGKNLSGVLDLSGFTALTSLDCSYNQLTGLDLSNLGNDIKYADICNNPLDLNSAEIMSVNRVMETVEKNGGTFCYAPQRGTPIPEPPASAYLTFEKSGETWSLKDKNGGTYAEQSGKWDIDGGTLVLKDGFILQQVSVDPDNTCQYALYFPAGGEISLEGNSEIHWDNYNGDGIRSDGDLTVSGTGTLTNSLSGIFVDGTFKMTGGTLTIGHASVGILARDFEMSGGEITAFTIREYGAFSQTGGKLTETASTACDLISAAEKPITVNDTYTFQNGGGDWVTHYLASITVPNSKSRLTLSDFAASQGASVIFGYDMETADNLSKNPIDLQAGENTLYVFISSEARLNSGYHHWNDCKAYRITVTREEGSAYYDSANNRTILGGMTWSNENDNQRGWQTNGTDGVYNPEFIVQNLIFAKQLVIECGAVPAGEIHIVWQSDGDGWNWNQTEFPIEEVLNENTITIDMSRLINHSSIGGTKANLIIGYWGADGGKTISDLKITKAYLTYGGGTPREVNIQIAPAYTAVKRGETATFTVAAAPSGSLGKVTWKLDGNEITGQTGASIDIPAIGETADSHEVSAEITVGGKIYKAFAELRVYDENSTDSITLSDTKVTLNLASKTGALLHYSAAGAGLSKDAAVKLYTRNKKELETFTAKVKDDRTIEIKQSEGKTAKTASNVTVIINDKKVGVINITVTAKYPKITFAADSLDLFCKDAPAVVRAYADGAEVSVDKIEIVSSPTPNGVKVDNGVLKLIDTANKTGKVKVNVTLSSPNYDKLSKNGNVFSTAVKIVNTDPKLTAPKNTITTKGKIDISNPDSAIFAAVKEKIVTVGLDSEYFKAVRISDQLFKIKVKDGAKPVPGVKYSLNVSINDVPFTKPLTITPTQTASKAVQSKKEITLYRSAAKIGEEITFDLTAPANVKLGDVKIQGSNLSVNFELVRTGQNNWCIRFKDGEAPDWYGNTTIKLELWAEGTYEIKDGKIAALMNGTKTASKPTIVSVKVNIK